MPVEQQIQAKIQRIEELRKYQAYYGPNTPYPVVLEINDLEAEVRHLLSLQQAQTTPPSKKPRAKKNNRQKKPTAPWWQVWRMSQATFDAIVTIAFIGFLFLLGSILLSAYLSTRSNRAPAFGFAQNVEVPPPTLRPTFTPTLDAAIAGDLSVAEAAVVDSGVILPPAVKEATEVPTPVPSITPTASPLPTETPIPTETPSPTSPPPQPPTATPAPPTATPAPYYPFAITEQGNRAFQPTTYHVITVYIAVVSADNVPLGGYKVIADNSSGGHIESGQSDWHWSVANCLDCGYIKQGNLKVELGPFADVVWNLYLADANGTPLSQPIPLSYASSQEQWVWDFLIFKQQ